jgi:hypothetical protein
MMTTTLAAISSSPQATGLTIGIPAMIAYFIGSSLFLMVGHSVL